MIFQRKILKWIRIYVLGSLAILLLGVLVIGTVMVSKAFDSKRLVDSQIEYNKTLTGQIGKPQVVEQRYITK